MSSREFEIDEPVADAAEASSFFIYAHERGLVYYASRDGGQHFTAVAHVSMRLPAPRFFGNQS